MIPVIPLLLIPYLQFFHNRKFMKKVFVFVVPLLFIFACGIQYKHYEFVKKEKYLSRIVRENIGNSNIIICNQDTDELFNPYFSNVKLIELSEIDKDKLDFLRKNYNISFIFVELKRGRLYEEKQGWIEFFKNEGFEISYESEEPVPVIVMSE